MIAEKKRLMLGCLSALAVAGALAASSAPVQARSGCKPGQRCGAPNGFDQSYGHHRGYGRQYGNQPDYGYIPRRRYGGPGSYVTPPPVGGTNAGVAGAPDYGSPPNYGAAPFGY